MGEKTNPIAAGLEKRTIEARQKADKYGRAAVIHDRWAAFATIGATTLSGISGVTVLTNSFPKEWIAVCSLAASVLTFFVASRKPQEV